jgi:hypothetical protein
MSEIIGVVNEMNNISNELKRIRKETMKLNKRKKDLEEKIIEYLKMKDQPGFKYQNMAVITEEKDIHNKTKKSEKFEKGINVLRNNGIDNAEDVLKELLDGMKGSPTTTTKLKIKEIKKK